MKALSIISGRFTAALLLLVAPVIWAGCSDSIMDPVEEPEAELQTQVTNKFQNRHLMDKAVRIASKGEDMTGLIFTVQPSRILDRYKIMDRYKILDRYEFDKAFVGFSIWTASEHIYKLIDLMKGDLDIGWIEASFGIDLPQSATERRMLRCHLG